MGLVWTWHKAAPPIPLKSPGLLIGKGLSLCHHKEGCENMSPEMKAVQERHSGEPGGWQLTEGLRTWWVSCTTCRAVSHLSPAGNPKAWKISLFFGWNVSHQGPDITEGLVILHRISITKTARLFYPYSCFSCFTAGHLLQCGSCVSCGWLCFGPEHVSEEQTPSKKPKLGCPSRSQFKHY